MTRKKRSMADVTVTRLFRQLEGIRLQLAEVERQRNQDREDLKVWIGTARNETVFLGKEVQSVRGELREMRAGVKLTLSAEVETRFLEALKGLTPVAALEAFETILKSFADHRALLAEVRAGQLQGDGESEARQQQVIVALGLACDALDALRVAVARSADETGFSTLEGERLRELFQAFVEAHRQILRERWEWRQSHAPTLGDGHVGDAHVD